MTCCCERCEPDNPGPTYTRDHLINCLGREIAALPSLSDRRARIESWEDRHGAELGEKLKAAVKAAFERAPGA